MLSLAASSVIGQDGQDGLMDGQWRHLSSTMLASTSVAFDPAADLLWSGDANGVVASYFPDSFSRYTSYKAHQPNFGPVRAILAEDRAVFSLGADSVKCANRRGLAAWSVQSEQKAFSAMSFSTAKAADLVVASAANGGIGPQPALLTINASTGSVIRKVRRFLSLQLICADDGCAGRPKRTAQFPISPKHHTILCRDRQQDQ